MSFYYVVSDDNDLIEFDYERYLMEEVKLRSIVDNPATSMVRLSAYCFHLLVVQNTSVLHNK